MDIIDLNEVYENLKSALNDVNKAVSEIGITPTEYEYYEYKNEENRYKTIKGIIEKEI